MTSDNPYKSYHFDCGNSTAGPIGFCARVTALDKQRAVELLRTYLRNTNEEWTIHQSMTPEQEGVENLIVYFNTEYVIGSQVDIVDRSHVGDFDTTYPDEVGDTVEKLRAEVEALQEELAVERQYAAGYRHHFIVCEDPTKWADIKAAWNDPLCPR